MSFKDKVAIITGAAGGIGRASAIRFARAGAKVVLADIDMKALGETQAEIGDNAAVQRTDVSDYEQLVALVQAARSAFGRVDVMFNNAGIAGARARTGEMSPQEWRRVIDVNLNGVFYGMRAAIPAMVEAGGGVIVNTASVDGLVGMGSLPHYTAAKHGVIGLTKACALEHARQNIRCVAIAPGYIRTAMTATAFSPEEQAGVTAMVPLGRAAEPDEVAALVQWLASSEASYVSGSCHTVDAGLVAGFQLGSQAR
ncbi:SDR family NAD(P)-dependent oxidoreductase [Burkholderia multivorans]|uniref:SDR family NAD(P)-dependent oxidoreductase n=1 Tax=Burkholderia multivorans TaxID=87883 RepID=UPI00075EC949|nr:SDR family NAD(P)-dependent oxidoreductase [Burkholderia multivorans]AOK67842.1 hypothetical protein WM33_20115 [Burkholderia multivorans]KVZ80349.1 hypothetical protein WL23_14110 [Burkholderia multivorans]